MPIRSLPENPSLENLRKQAKRLCKGVRAGEPECLAQLQEFHPGAASSDFSLAGAQRVVARSHGFPSWTKLKAQVQAIGELTWDPATGARDATGSLVEVFLRHACLNYGDWNPSRAAEARRLLAEHPELARADIYTAAAVGDVPAAREMLDRDPALVGRKGGPLGWPPLLHACYSRLDSPDPHHSTLELARLLLARAADPNAGFLWRGLVPPFTALTGAFGEGEQGSNQPPHPQAMPLARLLLEAGADPNDGQTLYNRGFKTGDEHLELLLAHGLGQDRRGPWFQRLGARMGTPAEMLAEELRRAAKGNRLERVKLLVEHGADVNRPTARTRRRYRDGRTPLEGALLAGNRDIAAYLRQHGAQEAALDPVQTFAAACVAGDRAEAAALLEEDPGLIEKLGPAGRAEMVHKAVDGRRPDSVRLLAALGFDLTAMTRNTPLHNAAVDGDLAMVRLLVELGADPTVREPSHHGTPLDWARHGGQQAVVDYLSELERRPR